MFAAAEPAYPRVAPAAPPVRLGPIALVDYRPAKCDYCGTDTWCELRGNKKRQCRACKVERFFSYVLYPPLGYELIDWQREILRDLYGTVKPEDGSRLYRAAFIEVAKKNGKSFLVGGMPIYNLLMEGEQNPEAYGGAAAKEQAGLVFKAAAQLVNANSWLTAQLKVLPSTKRIVRRDGKGFYAVLSADGELQDGIEPSLSLRDELHRWKTARAETLRDVMTKGQISRQEPLDVVITTAGAEYESPLWLEEYEQAKRVAEGVLKIETLYVKIYEPDLKRINSDPTYWQSREARVAANPSHEDCGGFLKDSAITTELQKALNNPRARSKYLRYHLNVPVKALEDPVIDMQKWQESAGTPDLSTWKEFDVEKVIEEWGLAGQSCFVGIDASWTTDLTAAVGIFPPFPGGPTSLVRDEEGVETEEENVWTLLPFIWMPEERVEALERTCRVPFSKWIEQGFLTATSGGAIDLRSVMERIKWFRDRFALVEVPYDRTNFRTQAMDLEENENITCTEVRQNFMELGAPTKFLLAAYPEKQIRHGNHPVMNWMASCMQLQYDQKDNCQPVKPPRQKSSKRIDVMQAIVTGFNRALVSNGVSVYQSRGLLQI